MKPQLKHLDEAREGAVAAMLGLLEHDLTINAAVVVDDLMGRISVYLWVENPSETSRVVEVVNSSLKEACVQYWTGSVNISNMPTPDTDQDTLRQSAWRDGIPIDVAGRLRLNDRHRNNTGWFVGVEASEQLWPLDQGPPVIVFHGFKGGAGRTTILASYALACVLRGEKVVVVDVDLDAPGIGLLLSADVEGHTAKWGTVDYLLESGHVLPLDDYFHVHEPEKFMGGGRLEVIPAGELNDSYLSKLGRVDLEVRENVRKHPLGKLLHRIVAERKPDIILMDGRAGLSPAAGLLLSGIAHLHVLIATTNAQTLQGLERVVRHLGYEQARRELPQRECIVVQAHVPDSSEVSRIARDYFSGQVEDIFRNNYYTRQPTEDDRTWSLSDLGSEIAPHVPIPISYRGKLAHFRNINEIADVLTSDPEYLALHCRIDERLGRTEQESTTLSRLSNEEESSG